MMTDMSKTDRLILCGAGFQTETLIRYFKAADKEIVCVLISHFTQRPEKCYLIPSKRMGRRNSFSEVDMLMDDCIEGVPVKRFDMLREDELSAAFLVTPDEESQSVYENISGERNLNFLFLTDDDLMEINTQVWGADALAKALWKTNRYLYSEMELLKNSVRRQLKSTVYDFHFEFHLVEHCNLKCAGCTHFSSIAGEEFLSLEEFEKDIRRLSELTGHTARFMNLLGGEPLLHPEVSSFFPIARRYFPDAVIRVVTNGIRLLDMEEEFWQSCKRNHIVIGLTQYPIAVDYEEIIRMISGKGVLFESFSGTSYPRDEMWRLALNEEGKERPVENFLRCPRANACIFISHGKVFNCATMANIGHFNKCFGTEFQLSKEDSIDIYEVNDIQEILSFLCNPKPFCRYCSIDGRKYGEKWSVTRRSPGEWLQLKRED